MDNKKHPIHFARRAGEGNPFFTGQPPASRQVQPCCGKNHQQGENMNTIKPRRISRAAFVTLIIIILLALALITPPGRAFAHSILQFFVRSQSDAIPMPTAQPMTWVDVTPGVPAATMTPLPAMAVFANECGDFGKPNLYRRTNPKQSGFHGQGTCEHSRRIVFCWRNRRTRQHSDQLSISKTSAAACISPRNAGQAIPLRRQTLLEPAPKWNRCKLAG